MLQVQEIKNELRSTLPRAATDLRKPEQAEVLKEGGNAGGCAAPGSVDQQVSASGGNTLLLCCTPSAAAAAAAAAPVVKPLPLPLGYLPSQAVMALAPPPFLTTQWALHLPSQQA